MPAGASSQEPLRQVVLGKIENAICLGTQTGIFGLETRTAELVDIPMMSETLAGQPVHLIQQDRQKNIHIITDSKVGYFRQISKNNYQFIPSSLYQLRYDLNTDLLTAGSYEEDAVLFSANQGFIYYLPNTEQRAGTELPLLIRHVRNINQGEYLYRQLPFSDHPTEMKSLVISQRTKALEIKVESFHFRNRNNHHFRYYLQGFDDQYSDWTSIGRKEYTNLSEGEYSLLVQTQNFLGDIQTSMPLHLKVRPPFYRSLFAKVLYTLGALALVVLLYRIQGRTYAQRTAKLEKERLMQLDAEQRKRQEVEEQKNRELSKLAEEKMHDELRHINNLLAASTMNLVVKNEFY